MKSFRYALQGLLTATRTEKNLRFHISAAVLVITAGFATRVSNGEWMLLIFCMALVIAFELFNTALEQLCNAVMPQHNIFIKNAKDMAAAAVLIVSIGSAVCGLIIFIPKIILLIQHS
jgi:diacylglycerol kinase